jgi:hypothetical protein
MAGGLSIKITFGFVATTNEPLYLHKQSFATLLQALFESLFSLTHLFNMAMVRFSNY